MQYNISMQYNYESKCKGDMGKAAAAVIPRNFHTEAPLQKRSTGITPFSFSWGKWYLPPILDRNRSEVISCSPLPGQSADPSGLP